MRSLPRPALAAMSSRARFEFATTRWNKAVLRFDECTARVSRDPEGRHVVRVADEMTGEAFTVGPFRDAAHAMRIGRHILWSAVNGFTPENGMKPMRAPRLRDFCAREISEFLANLSLPLAEGPVGRKARAGGEP